MHPYSDLAARHFWSTAVAHRAPEALEPLWQPKWLIDPAEPVVTFGSCFAQHIGQALFKRGYHWANYEPAPRGLSAKGAADFNFGVFSARTGNIYTPNMLRQWVRWSRGQSMVPEAVWQRGDRFFDPFRPAIEPDGFATPAEVRASREITLESFAEALRQARLFVFTLGLTESWQDRAGFEYAICPGTVAGSFDPDQHLFLNQDYRFLRDTLCETIDLIRAINPAIRFLLTVSPVPLTATAAGQHVLVASMGSKSTLRAVAGDLAACLPHVDYFPSYELIAAASTGGRFFGANQRSVTPEGVALVMRQFFEGQARGFGLPMPTADAAPVRAETTEDLICEERLLDAFARKPATQGPGTQGPGA